MPSSTQQTTAEERARLRRNQRNSRARKQAYVEELEQKWTQCLETGAQASVELQQAARKVARENDFLRSMLREQGVDDATLNARFRQFMDTNPNAVEGCMHNRSCVTDSTSNEQQTALLLGGSVPCCRKPAITHQHYTAPMSAAPKTSNSVVDAAPQESTTAANWETDGWFDHLFNINGVSNDELQNAFDTFLAPMTPPKSDTPLSPQPITPDAFNFRQPMDVSNWPTTHFFGPT